MTSFTPDSPERSIAEKVLEAIRSDKYKSKVYLFLEPFDINQVPGYLEKVGRHPIDLQTISNKLAANGYTDAIAFWNDVNDVFQNAIKYHADRDTKWIAKLAKDMQKAVARERKAIENGGYSSNPKPKTKLKVKLKPSPESAAAAATPSSVVASSSTAIAPSPKVKPKIKLKMSTASTGNISAATTSSLKQDSMDPGVAKAEAKKSSTSTKLKLKLSLKKKSESTNPKEASTASSATLTQEPPSSSPPPPPPPPPPKQKIKISTGGPSRGKELPQGVSQPPPPPPSSSSNKSTKSTAPSANKKIKLIPSATNTTTTNSSTTAAGTSTTVTTSSKSKKSTTTTATSTSSWSSSSGGGKLDETQKAQCAKVLAGLKRRKHKYISWFASPVNDRNIVDDYKAKIPHPMDLGTIQSKLEKNTSHGYKNLAGFVLDVRRVFANALRYNTSIKDSLRPIAVEMLLEVERLLQIFIARPYPHSYPPLLYCWKLCIDAMDTLYNMVNPSDGQPLVLYFLYPVSCYCGGQFPADYLACVSKPMDFGTVTANLVEARYQNADGFASDCRLVIQNCQTYYAGREEGKIFVEQAQRLNESLSRQLDQLARYDKSMKGASDRQAAMELHDPVKIQEMVMSKKPPPAVFLTVLDDLRGLTYTDKATKITEPAMGPFEKPVNLAVHTEYLQSVTTPIDLQSVERKVKSGVYEMPEDFEFDINLMFQNSEVYNTKRNDQHSVSIAKFSAKKFRGIFYSRMQAFEDPASSPQPKLERQPSEVKRGRSSPTSSVASAPPAKKIKIDTTVPVAPKAPRISITAAQISSATAAAATMSRANKPQPPRKAGTSADPNEVSNEPIPLHIAINRVKAAFPLRRALKDLQPWEADCARFFKELMRHPWISATRPKFYFHVPVPMLFPVLRDIYASKIRTPMDLTTVECTLLAGNRYATPDDFVQDVALVFANAIRFNKDGRDIGDPLSCAYYDASVHLLRYSRWLSLELLSSHLDRSEYTDDSGANGLPPFSWRLTEGNRKLARREMEHIVLKESIEKSLEGDVRYTWMETECEKLLKALRHQSDLRYMTFFIQPNYPADYTAYISKPMDWERVQRTLKKRQYDTFGNMVDDLRLIFSNALKYNARLKGTDTVSGRAYEAAVYMSAKLEAAINKFLLSVSDRLERERIDHGNAEREIEAAERAEEAEIRATWKKGESDTDATGTERLDRNAISRTGSMRRAPIRRQTTDFEIPFFDEEDDGQHERSYFEVVKFQKSMFEKQRQELSKMRKGCASIGVSLFARLIQRDELFKQTTEQEKSRRMVHTPKEPTIAQQATVDMSAENGPSSVREELEREGRGPLQIRLKPLKQPKKASTMPKPFLFEL